MAERIKKRILQGLTLFIILLILYYPGYRRVQLARERNRAMVERIERLKKENAELEKRLEMLKNDMVYIEQRAREKLGIVEEGEIVYEFVPSQNGNEKRGGAVR